MQCVCTLQTCEAKALMLSICCVVQEVVVSQNRLGQLAFVLPAGACQRVVCSSLSGSVQRYSTKQCKASLSGFLHGYGSIYCLCSHFLFSPEGRLILVFRFVGQILL